MACEVAVERTLTAAFTSAGVAHLEDAVLGFLNGYNRANEKNLSLYVALTGDAITTVNRPAF